MLVAVAMLEPKPVARDLYDVLYGHSRDGNGTSRRQSLEVRECTDESKTKEFRGKGSSLARRGILVLDDDLPKLVLVRVEVDTIRGNMCLFYTWVSRICNQDGAVARVRPRGRSAPREAACRRAVIYLCEKRSRRRLGLPLPRSDVIVGKHPGRDVEALPGPADYYFILWRNFIRVFDSRAILRYFA